LCEVSEQRNKDTYHLAVSFILSSRKVTVIEKFQSFKNKADLVQPGSRRHKNDWKGLSRSRKEMIVGRQKKGDFSSIDQ
jgi:hypothetical protein